jgi:hypothetical protein
MAKPGLFFMVIWSAHVEDLFLCHSGWLIMGRLDADTAASGLVVAVRIQVVLGLRVIVGLL